MERFNRVISAMTCLWVCLSGAGAPPHTQPQVDSLGRRETPSTLMLRYQRWQVSESKDVPACDFRIDKALQKHIIDFSAARYLGVREGTTGWLKVHPNYDREMASQGMAEAPRILFDVESKPPQPTTRMRMRYWYSVRRGRLSKNWILANSLSAWVRGDSAEDPKFFPGVNGAHADEWRSGPQERKKPWQAIRNFLDLPPSVDERKWVDAWRSVAQLWMEPVDSEFSQECREKARHAATFGLLAKMLVCPSGSELVKSFPTLISHLDALYNASRPEKNLAYDAQTLALIFKEMSDPKVRQLWAKQFETRAQREGELLANGECASPLSGSTQDNASLLFLGHLASLVNETEKNSPSEAVSGSIVASPAANSQQLLEILVGSDQARLYQDYLQRLTDSHLYAGTVGLPERLKQVTRAPGSSPSIPFNQYRPVSGTAVSSKPGLLLRWRAEGYRSRLSRQSQKDPLAETPFGALAGREIPFDRDWNRFGSEERLELRNWATREWVKLHRGEAPSEDVLRRIAPRKVGQPLSVSEREAMKSDLVSILANLDRLGPRSEKKPIGNPDLPPDQRGDYEGMLKLREALIQHVDAQDKAAAILKPNAREDLDQLIKRVASLDPGGGLPVQSQLTYLKLPRFYRRLLAKLATDGRVYFRYREPFLELFLNPSPESLYHFMKELEDKDSSLSLGKSKNLVYRSVAVELDGMSPPAPLEIRDPGKLSVDQRERMRNWIISLVDPETGHFKANLSDRARDAVVLYSHLLDGFGINEYDDENVRSDLFGGAKRFDPGSRGEDLARYSRLQAKASAKSKEQLSNWVQAMGATGKSIPTSARNRLLQLPEVQFQQLSSLEHSLNSHLASSSVKANQREAFERLLWTVDASTIEGLFKEQHPEAHYSLVIQGKVEPQTNDWVGQMLAYRSKIERLERVLVDGLKRGRPIESIGNPDQPEKSAYHELIRLQATETVLSQLKVPFEKAIDPFVFTSSEELLGLPLLHVYLGGKNWLEKGIDKEKLLSSLRDPSKVTTFLKEKVKLSDETLQKLSEVLHRLLIRELSNAKLAPEIVKEASEKITQYRNEYADKFHSLVDHEIKRRKFLSQKLMNPKQIKRADELLGRYFEESDKERNQAIIDLLEAPKILNDLQVEDKVIPAHELAYAHRRLVENFFETEKYDDVWNLGLLLENPELAKDMAAAQEQGQTLAALPKARQKVALELAKKYQQQHGIELDDLFVGSHVESRLRTLTETEDLPANLLSDTVRALRKKAEEAAAVIQVGHSSGDYSDVRDGTEPGLRQRAVQSMIRESASSDFAVHELRNPGTFPDAVKDSVKRARKLLEPSFKVDEQDAVLAHGLEDLKLSEIRKRFSAFLLEKESGGDLWHHRFDAIKPQLDQAESEFEAWRVRKRKLDRNCQYLTARAMHPYLRSLDEAGYEARKGGASAVEKLESLQEEVFKKPAVQAAKKKCDDAREKFQQERAQAEKQLNEQLKKAQQSARERQEILAERVVSDFLEGGQNGNSVDDWLKHNGIEGEMRASYLAGIEGMLLENLADYVESQRSVAKAFRGIYRPGVRITDRSLLEGSESEIGRMTKPGAPGVSLSQDQAKSLLARIESREKERQQKAEAEIHKLMRTLEPLGELAWDGVNLDVSKLELWRLDEGEQKGKSDEVFRALSRLSQYTSDKRDRADVIQDAVLGKFDALGMPGLGTGGELGEGKLDGQKSKWFGLNETTAARVVIEGGEEKIVFGNRKRIEADAQDALDELLAVGKYKGRVPLDMALREKFSDRDDFWTTGARLGNTLTLGLIADPENMEVDQESKALQSKLHALRKRVYDAGVLKVEKMVDVRANKSERRQKMALSAEEAAKVFDQRLGGAYKHEEGTLAGRFANIDAWRDLGIMVATLPLSYAAGAYMSSALAAGRFASYAGVLYRGLKGTRHLRQAMRMGGMMAALNQGSGSAFENVRRYQLISKWKRRVDREGYPLNPQDSNDPEWREEVDRNQDGIMDYFQNGGSYEFIGPNAAGFVKEWRNGTAMFAVAPGLGEVLRRAWVLRRTGSWLIDPAKMYLASYGTSNGLEMWDGVWNGDAFQGFNAKSQREHLINSARAAAYGFPADELAVARLGLGSLGAHAVATGANSGVSVTMDMIQSRVNSEDDHGMPTMLGNRNLSWEEWWSDEFWNALGTSFTTNLASDIYGGRIAVKQGAKSRMRVQIANGKVKRRYGFLWRKREIEDFDSVRNDPLYKQAMEEFTDVELALSPYREEIARDIAKEARLDPETVVAKTEELAKQAERPWYRWLFRTPRQDVGTAHMGELNPHKTEAELAKMPPELANSYRARMRRTREEVSKMSGTEKRQYIELLASAGRSTDSFIEHSRFGRRSLVEEMQMEQARQIREDFGKGKKPLTERQLHERPWIYRDIRVSEVDPSKPQYTQLIQLLAQRHGYVLRGAQIGKHDSDGNFVAITKAYDLARLMKASQRSKGKSSASDRQDPGNRRESVESFILRHLSKSPSPPRKPNPRPRWRKG